ncbi:AraC family transcriptional regulator [Bremerella alba]|uniref:Xylose operon regulatory protein n=1 Tax=Bremerella alba TaxID=980252 RepID=A0A7V8V0V2_9BACT|nr:DNA-binding transcriptional regulator [Bremerella alba]MBA2112870.1 Xylose operon regulatory protein [Bremerella alba]
MSDRFQIALLVETSRGHGRQIIEGVARYSAEHGPWSLRMEPRNLNDPPPSWLKFWDGDGIIVRCDSAAMAKAIQATKLPVIDVRGGVPEANFPLVGVDNNAITDASFEHFQQRGYRHIAWYDFGIRKLSWGNQRRARLIQRANQTGITCSVFSTKQKRPSITTQSQHAFSDLINWLAQLPRPTGILACDDEQAHLILDAAQHLEIQVPNDLAVLGIDNDEVFCRVSNPPLSSVDVNAVAVGYKAAEMLHRQLQNKQVPSRTLLPPRGVVTRQSSDIIAVEDPEVASALNYIRENACQPIQASDVAEFLSVSRSTLDRYFQVAIGQTTTDAIMQARLGQVKTDLVNTDLPLKSIAARSGFASVQHLANLFRERVGTTPGNYRKDMRY